MSHYRALAAAAAVLLIAPLGRAAELDLYLPEDTESILNLNVRQLLDSGLVKKYFLELAREALRGSDEIQDILKDLGFDPFKDLDRIIIAAPVSTEKDRGLVIVHGRFDVAKFKDKAEDAAKDYSDHLKIHKILNGKHLLYEVNLPERDDPIFVGVASRDTLLISPGKDYVVNALKRSGKETSPVLKNKRFQELLEKVDARQSLSLAMVANPDIAKAVQKAPGNIKEMIGKIRALGGGLAINDEIKLELAVTTKNTQDAKELCDSAKAGLNAVLAIAAPLVQNGGSPGAELVVEIIKGLRVTNKAETVLVKGLFSGDLIDDALKKKDK